jgi:GNAT superfamily N-acetyltransferase
MPADTLVYVPFTPDLLAVVGGFDCGDESYQQELAHWIREDSVPALLRGTKVWLYRNQAGDLIGYSSLGTTRWHYPDPTSPRTLLVIVPAVAIRKPFWGKPDGPPEDRYSSQIMRHLLKEADAWPGQPPAVGLFVHPDNHSAVKLYERFGFQLFFHTYTDRDTGVVYRSLVRPLIRGETKT